LLKEGEDKGHMLKNYILTAVRSIRKSAGYSILNVVGLATGLTVFILAGLYVRHELSYDRYHANTSRILRVIKQDPGNVYMGTDRFAVTPAPLAGALVKEYPEVEAATRFFRSRNALLSRGERGWLEPDLIWTDPQTFEIFSFDLFRGNARSALRDPNSVVLSERAAKRYFGAEDPMGKTLTFRPRNQDLAIDFVVTGIFRDLPANSHFGMDVVLPFEAQSAVLKQNLSHWGQNNYYTYILLRPGADAGALEAKLPGLIDKYAGDDVWVHEGRKTKYILQPLASIHLRSHVNFEFAPTGDAGTVGLSLTIAFLVLLIACVNYMNLATARATLRAREVGMRKVIGARASQIVGQFLGEAVVLSMLALAGAAGMVATALPALNAFVGRRIAFDPLGDPALAAGMVCLAVIVGIAAGSYPAFVLSGFRPAAVLKRMSSGTGKGGGIRNTLVVFQFSVSVALIVCGLGVRGQLRYIRGKDMGFNRNQVVVLPVRDFRLRAKMKALEAELKRYPGVVRVSASSSLPNNIESQTSASWPGKPENVDLPIYFVDAGYEFADLYELKLAAGRNFSRELDSIGENRGAFLINESAAKAMGVPSPVGMEFGRWGGTETAGKIVGVLKDFHMHSLHLPIAPLYVFLDPGAMNYISIRIGSGDIPRTMDAIRATMARFSPEYPFEYSFFDDVFDRAYQADRKAGRLFGAFALVAVLIACLGLFGLASFAAARRTREIGIRKVVGASTSDIVVLLSKGFLPWIVAANALAWPVGYLAMKSWLRNFAYRIELTPWLFALAAAASLGVAALAIGARTLRAAAADPVEALRYE
jgi:putative ABC transport system permease protein